MTKDMLKSLGMGMLVMFILLSIAFIGTHTLLELLVLPFTIPFAIPAAGVGYQITKVRREIYGRPFLWCSRVSCLAPQISERIKDRLKSLPPADRVQLPRGTRVAFNRALR